MAPVNDWAKTKELRGARGILILMFVQKLMGRKAVHLLLYPLIGCYYLFAHKARTNSQRFLRRVEERRAALGLPEQHYSSFTHFMSFGVSLYDKIAAWRGDLLLGRDVVFAEGAKEVLYHDNLGKVVLTSHLGDIEVCRALASQSQDKIINALVFYKNAKAFNDVLEKVAPKSNLNLIYVENIGPDTAILLKEKIEKGEWVAIMADRVPVNAKDDNTISVDFMGRPAPFAIGPMVLASLMQCEVLTLMALRENPQQIKIYAQSFTPRLVLPRKSRQAELTRALSEYAKLLEHYAITHPYAWYSFYDFWKEDDDHV